MPGLPLLAIDSTRIVPCQSVQKLRRQQYSRRAGQNSVLGRLGRQECRTPSCAYRGPDWDSQRAPRSENSKWKSTQQAAGSQWASGAADADERPGQRVGISAEARRPPSFDLQLLLLLGLPAAFLVTPWIVEHPLAALVPAALALVPPTSLFLQPALAAAARALIHALYSGTGAARAQHAAREPLRPQEPSRRAPAGPRVAKEEVLLLPIPPDDGSSGARATATYAADFSRGSPSPTTTSSSSSSSGEEPSATQAGWYSRQSAPAAAARAPRTSRAASGLGGQRGPRRHVTLAEVRAAAAARSAGSRSGLQTERGADRTLWLDEEERLVRRSSGRSVGVDMRYRAPQPWWRRFVSGIVPFFLDLFGLEDY